MGPVSPHAGSSSLCLCDAFQACNGFRCCTAIGRTLIRAIYMTDLQVCFGSLHVECACPGRTVLLRL